MKPVLLSVVMSVYNAEKYLNKAIKSILEQSFSEFEFIIINDGSTDDSLAIIEKFQEADDRIVLISRENRGLISSLNEGFEKAKGEYVARMDADDFSHKDRFELQLEKIQSESADICGCHYFVLNDRDKLVDTVLVPLDRESLYLFLALAVPFAHGSVIIRRQFLTDNNLSYGAKFRYAEDKYLWMQMFQKGAVFVNVNDVLFFYRETQDSKSRIESNEMYLDDKNIRNHFLEEYSIDFETVIQGLSQRFDSLSVREQEHLLDLCFLLRKKRMVTLKKAAYRLRVVAICKYMSKVFRLGR